MIDKYHRTIGFFVVGMASQSFSQKWCLIGCTNLMVWDCRSETWWNPKNSKTQSFTWKPLENHGKPAFLVWFSSLHWLKIGWRPWKQNCQRRLVNPSSLVCCLRVQWILLSCRPQFGIRIIQIPTLQSYLFQNVELISLISKIVNLQ